MYEWWNALGGLQQVFYIIAVPSTVVLLLQSLLLILGLGDGDMDSDIPDDGIPDVSHGADGFALFSVRGIVAFFAVGGWTGVALLDAGAAPVLSIAVAFIAGSVALVAVALILKSVLGLQDAGNVQLQNAIGQTAKVYITIPANYKETGKITLTFQGRFMECDAVTDDKKDIKTGESVVVTKLFDQGTLQVERLHKASTVNIV